MATSSRTEYRKRTQSPLRLDLPNFVPYRITTLAALVRRALADIYRSRPGLTEPEWKVMTALAHYGPMPSGDVGLYVTLDRVAVSRALARLIKLKLATRAPNRRDQRMFTVDLTPRAARLYDRMAREALAIEERILAKVEPDQVRTLLALLDKVESCFRSEQDLRRQWLITRSHGSGEASAPATQTKSKETSIPRPRTRAVSTRA